jgi:hypothetical protein
MKSPEAGRTFRFWNDEPICDVAAPLTNGKYLMLHLRRDDESCSYVVGRKRHGDGGTLPISMRDSLGTKSQPCFADLLLQIVFQGRKYSGANLSSQQR